MRLAQVQTSTVRRVLFGLLFLVSLTSVRGQAPPGPSGAAGAKPAEPVVTGVQLGDLTWQMAEQRLKPDAVVMIPLGAAAQEHGPHLKLRNDQILAEYFTRRILEIADVIAAPPLPYHYFPAFNEYPGSTSVSLNVARDLTADVVRSIARHGPRRYYVLNTGYSSAQALAEAAKLLAGEGILLRYTDWRSRMEATRGVQQQPGGNHAEEVETSMMLYIDPSVVNMAAAQRDYSPSAANPFQLTRNPVGGRGTYSPTGAWGDPTLATRDKGRVVVETTVGAIRTEVEELRRAPLPRAGATAPPLTAGPRDLSMPPSGGRPAGECLQGDERYIRELGAKFYVAWLDQDAPRLAGFWADGGDMAHPDGLVETTAQVIRENRAYLFQQREFRGSRHFLTIGQVRCITADVAIADAKWELRGVTDGRGNPTPPAEGLCTLVMRRMGGGWAIEAWRYNMKPASAATQPTILKKPGFLPPIR
jgi:creatinine amidohydrolase